MDETIPSNFCTLLSYCLNRRFSLKYLNLNINVELRLFSCDTLDILFVLDLPRVIYTSLFHALNVIYLID